ncbi:hypothetical protein T492DRAFT_871493 [Pavlovales sp. CCMP2436]|nr:hypothetical protein T492DRAFT_871493 [Pavlovales sp. CCMP2436]
MPSTVVALLACCAVAMIVASAPSAANAKKVGDGWRAVGDDDEPALSVSAHSSLRCFVDDAHGQRATVLELRSGISLALGQPGFTKSAVSELACAVYDGRPIVVLQDEAGGALRALAWVHDDGHPKSGRWTRFGIGPLSDGLATRRSGISMAPHEDGLYIGYTEESEHGTMLAVVKMLSHSSTWVTIGSWQLQLASAGVRQVAVLATSSGSPLVTLRGAGHNKTKSDLVSILTNDSIRHQSAHYLVVQSGRLDDELELQPDEEDVEWHDDYLSDDDDDDEEYSDECDYGDLITASRRPGWSTTRWATCAVVIITAIMMAISALLGGARVAPDDLLIAMPARRPGIISGFRKDPSKDAVLPF